MNRYIGITFGPITRTLGFTKSIRSIWAASYFFSHLAESVMRKYIDDGRTFFKPTITPMMREAKRHDTVGIFPDQYIFVADKDDNIASVRSHCDEALIVLAKKMAEALRKDVASCTNYLKENIKIYLVEYSMEGDEATVVNHIQNLLTSAEMRDVFSPHENTNLLARLFASDKDSLSKLFGVEVNKVTNLQEISYKNYVAFVSADGDNFSRTIAQSGKSECFADFSRALTTVVNIYGGQVIYQGGDDIAFYAPIYSPSLHTDLFGLIATIDDVFKSTVQDVVRPLGFHTSLSYGVAIAYEKHPMGETRQAAEELLGKAKKKEGKNAICWQMRKHSGQTSSGTMLKRYTNLHNACQELIAQSLKSMGDTDDETLFLHSLTFWLERQREALICILGGEQHKSMLDNFVANNFNEEGHVRHKEQMEAVKKVLLSHVEALHTPDEAVDYTCSILRYIELLLREEPQKGEKKNGK
ncbi:MAG: hypothetical protein LIO90_00890 [Bacteroidales bacterium]|nr:hypothetical protein [Bacteroidales bacterium]